MNKRINIKEKLGKLEEIASWFDKQKEVDVEEGLKKVKEGNALVKELRERLSEVENEFEELKKDLD
ncbi:MAG TPA: exodeoxyribonuclease VII small subunit [Candidatus Paceibacterota bacterium]